MSDLVEFLRARLDEDEQAASAAVPGPWIVRDGWDYEAERAVFGSPRGVQHVATTKRNEARWRENRDHIARHDPARVLAEVEAKRRILDEHRDEDGNCYGCGLCNDGERRYKVDECPTKRALALPYSDHPDYREEWRP